MSNGKVIIYTADAFSDVSPRMREQQAKALVEKAFGPTEQADIPTVPPGATFKVGEWYVCAGPIDRSNQSVAFIPHPVFDKTEAEELTEWSPLTELAESIAALRAEFKGYEFGPPERHASKRA